jgi:hypothetical protein
MYLSRKAEAFARAYHSVPYNYENGPVAESAINWFVEGLNCQLLIHVAFSEFFKVHLPNELRSSELFADTEWLENIQADEIKEGDLFFMGPTCLQPQRNVWDEDAKKLHLALVTTVDTGIELLHARPKEGIIIESLEKIRRIERSGKRPYEQVFAVKRLKAFDFLPR